jgi:hypothetical protein
VRASWALYNVDPLLFDPDKAIVLLGKVGLARDWSTHYPYILERDDDPWQTLEDLLDLIEDIDVVVDVYAQSMNALVEVFVNPFVEPLSVELSREEYSRIASSFLLLKIFYQHQQHFAYHKRSNIFFRTFFQDLDPWQVEQTVAVEYYLQTISNLRGTSLNNLIEEKHRSKDILSERSLYIRDYLSKIDIFTVDFCSLDEDVNKKWVSFSRASRHYWPHSMFSVWRTPPQLLPDFDHATARVQPLYSHGWEYCEYLRRALPYSEQDLNYQHFFLGLGIFFWDQDRLDYWGIIDFSEFLDMMEVLHERMSQNSEACRNWQHYGAGGLWRNFRLHPESIMEWTRCEVQCTYDEWAYERYALGPWMARRQRETERALEPKL